MGDRMDIDALLIGALYGELTPADEARLAAHLESHPADRTALADLTRTRATVRESRVFAVQFDPPQAVSALLLQEAARRLPKREREGDRESGWFYRLARAFMVHPGLATAAMAVVVVGVVGALYVRRGSLPMAETAPPPLAISTPSGAAGPQSTPAPPPPVATVAPTEEHEKREQIDKNEGLARSVPAKPDAYRVDVDDRLRRNRASSDADLQVAEGRADGAARPEPTGAKLGVSAGAAPGRLAASEAKPAPPAQKAGGIVVRTPQLQPKELDDASGKDLAKTGTYSRADTAANDKVQTARRAGAGGALDGDPAGPAPATVAPMPPTDVPAAAPAAANEPVNLLRAEEVAKKAKAPSKASVAQTRAPAPAAPPPPPAATRPAEPQRDSGRFAEKPKAAENKADEKASDDRALLGWARKQHDQVIALVKASNCRAAASAAVEIYNRAPDYYASNVATDRSVKACMPYLNSERDREDRSRAAAKRAYSTDAPAASPPSKK